MSSTDATEHSLDRYYFWAWQYTARNPEFIKNRDMLVRTVRALEESGIMSEHVSLTEVVSEYLWEVRPEPWTVLSLGSPLENGWATRGPTAEEREMARQALGLQSYFSAFCYEYRDIMMAAVPAERILSSSDTYVAENAFPRKQVYASSYPFTSNRSLLDTTPLPGLFQTFIGTEEGGKRKLVIDFNLPLDIILCQIQAIYELIHGAQGPATEHAIRMIVKSHRGLSLFDEEPRIIGLWLWDYVQVHGGKTRRGVVQEAVNAVRKRLEGMSGALNRYADSEDRVFQNLRHRTGTCITHCNVLPFK